MYKFDENLSIEELPATVYRQLVNELNSDYNWNNLGKHVSEQLGLGPAWVKSLEFNELSKLKTSAEKLLTQLSMRMCTVGILADLLEDCELLGALSIIKESERLIITRHPNSSCQEVKVSLGQKIHLFCEATGLPPPSYTWYHENSILNHKKKDIYLVIENVGQEGEYRCLVTQIDADGVVLEQLMSESVYLTVKPTPIVVERQPALFAEIERGKSLSLSCRVQSHPEPVYQWFRDNTRLANQTFPELKIENFDMNDEGKYYCHIKNQISEVFTERSNVIMELPREKATAKIALLIANENYDQHDKLKTPRKDVGKLAELLEEIGFKVICFVNLNIQQMKNAMKFFCATLTEGVYGLFYFAGHGFKMQESYILPVDAPKTFLRSDAICESEILATILPKDLALLVVILDTCQTVPPKESNPDIHAEIPKVNEYRSKKNLRNLIQAYSTSSHRPSYERSSSTTGLYITHLSKFITKDIPVQRVFEEVGKSIDTWFKGRERNQIPMFSLTVTKPYRLTDAISAGSQNRSLTKINEFIHFPSKNIDIKFQKTGINCRAVISPCVKPFLNVIKVSFQEFDDLSINLLNLVPVNPNNLFRMKSNEFRVINPQMSKGPLVISIERNGTQVGASTLKLMDHVPRVLHNL